MGIIVLFLHAKIGEQESAACGIENKRIIARRRPAYTGGEGVFSDGRHGQLNRRQRKEKDLCRHVLSFTSTCSMPHRSSISARVLIWLSLVACIASAYMVEVPASRKECFFEDLHENDKARIRKPTAIEVLTQTIDDSNLSSRRWGTHGYRFLGQKTIRLPYMCANIQADDRSGQPRITQTSQTNDWDALNYCQEGWET